MLLQYTFLRFTFGWSGVQLTLNIEEEEEEPKCGSECGEGRNIIEKTYT